jgi:predicted NBD/HSP70 family sugar kinase
VTEHDAGAKMRTWPHLTGVERGALRELLIHGPLPRAEMARRLHVSRASMTRATRILVENSLIAEDEITLRGAMGRPSEMLAVSDDAHHLLGVKLTGDAVFAVVTTLGARIVASVEEPLVSNSVEDTVDQIVRIHARFAETFGDIHAAGICLAGDLATVDGEQIVVASYFLRWREVPLATLLSERIGIPVTADNDVRALTAAEHWFGAGAGCDSLALVTVGAGIGFGLVVDGRVVTGHNGRAGQLDHLLVDTTGPECGVGHRGCASAYLPSACIVQAIRDADADADAELDYDGAVARARGGDPIALRAFGDAARALGVIIGTIMSGLDPEKIVLTGDGLAVMELQSERVMQAIKTAQLPSELPVPLDVQPFEFTEWARAGAVLAIRSLLRF